MQPALSCCLHCGLCKHYLFGISEPRKSFYRLSSGRPGLASQTKLASSPQGLSAAERLWWGTLPMLPLTKLNLASGNAGRMVKCMRAFSRYLHLKIIIIFSDLLMTMINLFECFFVSVNRLSKQMEHVCIQVFNIGKRVISSLF